MPPEMSKFFSSRLGAVLVCLVCGAATVWAASIAHSRLPTVALVFRYTLFGGSTFFLLYPLVWVPMDRRLSLPGFLWRLSFVTGLLVLIATVGNSVLLLCHLYLEKLWGYLTAGILLALFVWARHRWSKTFFRGNSCEP